MRFSAGTIARLTLIAFLFNALLPFFAVYNVSAASAPALFGDKILICSEGGFKWINRQDAPRQPHANYKCPLCYLAAHGFSAITPEAFTFISLSADAEQNHSYYSYRPAGFTLQLPSGSRAPPASFTG